MYNINLPTIRLLLIPLLVMLTTTVLLVIVFTNLFPRVKAQLGNIQKTQKIAQSLEDKIEVLSTFKGDAVSDRTDITYLVLPDSNPAPVVISQLKRTLVSEGITEPLKVSLSGSGIPEGEINKNSISIEFVSQDLNQIISSLNAFLTIAPLVTIDSVAINLPIGTPSAEVGMSVYWADLPAKLPEASQPVSSLSTAERQILDKIVGFDLPEFQLNSPATPSIDRVNPFN